MNRINPSCVCLAVSLAFLLALICTSVPAANGQAITATLSGRILDTSGGSVSKARVTITSAATGFVRTVQSSDTGEYTIPALKAGEYTVSVEFPGVRKQSKHEIFHVGHSAQFPFPLTPPQLRHDVTHPGPS